MRVVGLRYTMGRRSRSAPMRLLSTLLAVPLLLTCGHAFAQRGDLAGVTMRVVDDLRGIDAVVLELEPPRGGERAESAEAEAVEPPAVDERGESRREEEGAERPVPQPQA
jgi:hypothetical protein